MEVKRREDWAAVWGVVMARGHGTSRRHNDWTLKITLVACCVALFFLSPGFSRMLPAGRFVVWLFFGRVFLLVELRVRL